MALSKTQATKVAKTEERQFVELGALFETSSEAYPFIGLADDSLLTSLGLEAPEGKEYKVFARLRTSKKGKDYLSLYLGLSDIRR